MKNKILVAPSILSANFSNIESDIKKIESANADWVHIDVMDGHFVPNITIGPCVIKDIKKITKLPLDVHLMITNPDKYVDDFIAAGSDIITFHYEALENKSIDLIKYIKSKGKRVGISIKPKTDSNLIKDYIDIVDLVLIMTVEPGFGGQKFIKSCAEKIKKIKKLAQKDLLIEVDGGINESTAMICKEYGANVLVAGNYIYKSDDIKSAIKSLRLE